MNPTVAVALITGGATGITGMTGATLGYLSARRQSESTVAALQQQAKHEVLRLEAENQRLRDQFAENERQHRQTSYHELLLWIIRVGLMATRWRTLTKDTFEQSLDNFYELYAGVVVFGDRSVVSAMKDVVDALSHMHAGLLDLSEEAFPTAFRDAFDAHRDALGVVGKKLSDAMREDVARHLSEL